MRSSPDADGACASISWNAAYDGAISMRESASGVNSASCSAGVKERSVAERLVEELGKPRHEVERYARAQDLFVMVGVERARDAARVSGLVEGGVFETDRKGLEAAGEVARGEGGDRARVDSPREEHAERHVAHEVLPHREIESPAECLHRVGLADRVVAAEVAVPVRPALDLARGVRW